MGTKVSLFCCSYCNTRVSTEEDEFLGIRAEVKQKQKEQIPLPFQEYLKRRNSLTDHDSMLNFLANPQIDYLTTDNKIMQRSAILDINEIPEIPTPKNDKLSSFRQKEKRSFSLSVGKSKKINNLLPLFMPNERKSFVKDYKRNIE